MKSLVENENLMIPLANKEDKKSGLAFLFVISKLAGVEFYNFQIRAIYTSLLTSRH